MAFTGRGRWSEAAAGTTDLPRSDMSGDAPSLLRPVREGKPFHRNGQETLGNTLTE